MIELAFQKDAFLEIIMFSRYMRNISGLDSSFRNNSDVNINNCEFSYFSLVFINLCKVSIFVNQKISFKFSWNIP